MLKMGKTDHGEKWEERRAGRGISQIIKSLGEERRDCEDTEVTNLPRAGSVSGVLWPGNAAAHPLEAECCLSHCFHNFFLLQCCKLGQVWAGCRARCRTHYEHARQVGSCVQTPALSCGTKC